MIQAKDCGDIIQFTALKTYEILNNKKNKPKFNLIFCITLIILVASPFVYPLSNPFTNPNTLFQDYPKPYQEAYAELTTPKHSHTIRYETSSHNIYTLGDKIYKGIATLGLPEFITDSDGDYVNTQVTEDPNFVYVDSRFPVKFSKSTCDFIELDKERIANNPDVRKTTTYTLRQSDDAITWSDVSATFTNKTGDFTQNFSCSVSYFTNSTGTFVTATHKKGQYEVDYVYAWYEKSSQVESFYIPHNLGKTAYYTGILETQTVADSLTKVTFDGSEYTATGTGIKESDEVTKDEVKQAEFTKEPAQVEDYVTVYEKGTDTFTYDATKAVEFLDSVTIKEDSGKLVQEIFYYKKDAKLDSDQTYIIDPTYSSSNPTVDGNIEDTNNDDVCNGTTLTKDTTGTSLEIGRDATTGSIDCDRAFFEFSISTIPPNADIVDSDFKFEADTPSGTPNNCVYVGMATQPSVGSDANIWSSISSDTTLVTDSACTTAGSSKSVDLSSAGDSYIDGRISSGWVAIAVKSATESPLDTNNYLAKILAEEGTGTPDPTLEVTYYIPIAPNAPQSALTATAQASAIQLNGTESSSGFDNATQPAETHLNLYRCVVEDCTSYLGHELEDSGSNTEGNEGHAKMGTLGNTLLYHFNSIGDFNGNDSFLDTHESGGGATNGTVTGQLTTETADKSDDFSGCTNTAFAGCTPTWTADSTTDFTSDTTNDEVDFSTDTTSTDAGIVSFDYGSTICATKCLVRIHDLVFSTAEQYGRLYIYISSVGIAGTPTASQDAIGIRMNDDHLTASTDIYFDYCDSDAATYSSGCTENASTKVGSADFVISQNYDFEIVVDGSSYTIRAWRNNFDQTLVKNHTSTHTATGLRYLNFAEGFADTASSNKYIGSFQKIEIFEGVTAPNSTSTAILIKGQFPRESTNNAVNLNNANINITSPDITFEGTNAWSFVQWLNMSDSDPFTLFSADMGSGRSTAINVNDNSITLHNTGTSVFNYSLTSMGTNKVNFLGITHSSDGNFCVYQNLTQVSCATTNSTTLGSSNTFFINSMPTMTNSGNINLDDFALFNTTLTQEQMLDLATRGSLFNFTKLYMNSTIAANQSGVVDNGPADSETWCYDYSYSNSVGQGPLFSTLSCATSNAGVTSQPPINVNAKLNGTIGSAQVKTQTIKWTPFNATYVTGYRIYNSTNNITYGLLVSGLANGTTFYNHNINEVYKQMFYKVYSEPYTELPPNPSKASSTAYNRTANYPTVSLSPTVTNPASNQLQLSWLIGANDGNSTRKDCSIRYDNTTTGDTGGWVTLVSNSTISGTCTNRQYTQTGLNAETSYTYQVREGNSIGFADWSANATGTVSAFTDITIRLFTNRTGDTVSVIPQVTFNAGNTGSGFPTLEKIRFYNASSNELINQTTLNSQFPLIGNSANYTRMYENLLGMQGSNYIIVVQVTNYSGSGIISTTENATISNLKAAYRTIYRTAETPSEGTYNFTHARDSDQDRLSIYVNRDTGSVFWDLECDFRDQIFDTASWVNRSNIAAYNITTTVDPRNNVIVKCWNDDVVFYFISYSNLNGTLAVTQYTEALGDFIGVPLPFFFVIFIAALFTGKNTVIGSLVLAGVIGTMGAMGFWPDLNDDPLLTAEIWGLIVFLAALGIFVGKRAPF